VRVKVLGAGGGEDVSNRLSSFLIDEKLLLDAGAVTRALSLKEQEKIKAVFLTHAHLDHLGKVPLASQDIGVYDGVSRLNSPELVHNILHYQTLYHHYLLIQIV